MFFDDDLLIPRKKATLKALPPVVDNGWRPPSYFPNLFDADIIAIDVETKEPDFDNGPGWSRGIGHIVGFSIAAQRGNEVGSWYYPLRHEVDTEYNLDAAPCFTWLKAMLETPIPKVGANLLYDIGWLTTEGIYVEGEYHDVQYAEALLDEDAFVRLDHLGAKYCGEGKTTDSLYQWLAHAYGGPVSDRQRANIYRAPARLVAPYAESDVRLPLRVLRAQMPLLTMEGLVPVYRMECDLIRLLTRMRLSGVSVDVAGAERLYGELGVSVKELYTDLGRTHGYSIESVDSNEQLGKLFDHAGVPYPRTQPSKNYPNGQPSFRKEWLKALEHPLGKDIIAIREHEKIKSTFIKSYLLESNVRGRVHCQFHGMKNDENGAKTGRFASSTPNLQNIPIRTKLGKQCRKLFIPHDGDACWRKYDYSQIEYRMLAHYAVGIGADELRAEYTLNPHTDYHDRTMTRFADVTRKDLSCMSKEDLADFRKPIKNVNFGLLYGQGESGLAYKAGMSAADAETFFLSYHSAAPYVKATMEAISLEASRAGFITTILDRRTRFNLWEPKFDRRMPLPHAAAVSEYGQNIKRSYTYRAVNYRFQGSAAEVIKKAMLKAHHAGIFEVTGVPLLQVHDELGFSKRSHSREQDEAYRELTHILETSLPLRVPVVVDAGEGENWGAIL